MDTHKAHNDELVYSLFVDDDDFMELLEHYASSVEEKKSDIQRLFQSDNYQQLAALAHQIKGSAGGYGFNGLTNIAAKLEEACRSNEQQAISEKVTEILSYLDRMRI